MLVSTRGRTLFQKSTAIIISLPSTMNIQPFNFEHQHHDDERGFLHVHSDDMLPTNIHMHIWCNECFNSTIAITRAFLKTRHNHPPALYDPSRQTLGVVQHSYKRTGDIRLSANQGRSGVCTTTTPEEKTDTPKQRYHGLAQTSRGEGQQRH